MRKVEIANRTFEELGITKEKAKDTVNGILDEVKQAMFEGESV
ncbi:MAG: HU family DNA-binding protein [Candidatus Tectomicrobia bacterium]|nr:HU family DNA-binding protein [Candidatus Tectomicrobia bacterium]